MTNTKAYTEAERISAMQNLETLHECVTDADIAERKTNLLLFTLCAVSSEWWQTLPRDKRDALIYQIVRVDETLTFLDTAYREVFES